MIGMIVMGAMRQTRKGQRWALPVSCAAAAGTTARGTVAPRTASGTCPASAATSVASAFVAPQGRANEEWNDDGGAKDERSEQGRQVARRPRRSGPPRQEATRPSRKNWGNRH